MNRVKVAQALRELLEKLRLYRFVPARFLPDAQQSSSDARQGGIDLAVVALQKDLLERAPGQVFDEESGRVAALLEGVHARREPLDDRVPLFDALVLGLELSDPPLLEDHHAAAVGILPLRNACNAVSQPRAWNRLQRDASDGIAELGFLERALERLKLAHFDGLAETSRDDRLADVEQ
jgi:hypothetical protein